MRNESLQRSADTIPPSADSRVFDWLRADAQGSPCHLPLNLMWSDAGIEPDLGVYRRVAERLASEPAYWSAIIRDINWRFSLIGCVCLLVSRYRGLFEDLRFRFEGGSMVIPQLAVTMGLLHPADARAYFELVLETPGLRDDPARRVSAERTLVCLGGRAASDVTLDGWIIKDRHHALFVDRVVQEHWDFWSKRV